MALRTLSETDHGRTDSVAKHLLDETAEFRMPRLPRHAADQEHENEVQLEATQRFDPGFRQSRPAVPPHEPTAR